MVFLLSIGMMVMDGHYHALSFVRNGLQFLTSPLQYAVDYPERFLSSVSSLLRSKANLIDENTGLRHEQALLQAELQRFMAIKEENSALKALLSASSQAKIRTMASRILAVDMHIARQFVVLDKGKRDGVYLGQPVLDAKGVVGQIVDVGYMTSTVMLISDSKSAVPVRNNRTGETALLTGLNHPGELVLLNLPKTSDIKKDDLLVTSGLGRLYPEGFPVGRVEKVERLSEESFMKVTVFPIAMLNRNRIVLLIWPDTEQAIWTKQIEERLQKARKSA